MDEGPSEEETNTATMRPMFEPAPREDVVAPAQEIGRFMVLGRVGAGGMGQVYAAYDPVLDRRVALKLLHAERGANDRDALVREAKALARLTHPHVVAVHDVGVHEGLVFLAMEYVEGSTLKAWASGARKRRLATTLDVLRQAGLGLAAAHEAELVHGDFKPQNVLVGDDGRVRVVDFGLARPEGTESKPRRGPASRTISDSETLEEESRQAVVGTPAYMAPEHVRYGRVDPRTDQYSYCVAAWEVIYGSRPPEIANGVELPVVVSAALKKGLSARPSARHRSMRPLLDAIHAASAELRGDHPKAVRRVVAAGGVLAVSGAVATAYWAGQTDEGEAPCSGAEAALASAWNSDVEEDVRAAILATGTSYAARSEAVVIERLDGFGQAWVEGYTDACEASQIRLEQSTEVMDLRMGCLDQRLRELRAVAGVLASVDAERVKFAIGVADGLAPPQDCADVEYVRERTRVPADPELRAEVAEAREALARVGAMHRAGRYAEAKAAAQDAVTASEALAFTPLLAEAKYHLGRELHRLEEAEPSIAALREAFLLAQTASDPAVATDAATLQSLAVGVLSHDLKSGLLWNDVALSLARREHGVAHGSLARGLSARSDIFYAHGDYPESLAVLEDSFVMLEPGTQAYAAAVATRGTIRDQLGDLEGGIADGELALQTYEALLGPDHPTIATLLYNLELSVQQAGRYEDALRLAKRARDIYIAQQGPEGRDVGSCVSTIAGLRRMLGEPKKALAEHREALRILRRVLGPAHVEIGAELMNMGMTLELLGRIEEAVESMRAGREIFAEGLGLAHPMSVNATMNLANVLCEVGEAEEAMGLYLEGLEHTQGGVAPRGEGLLRSNLGLLYAERGEFEAAIEQYSAALRSFESTPESFAYQNTLANAAEVWLETGRGVHALEKSEELLKLSSDDPSLVARAQFLVARGLWQTGGDRARARALAEQAIAAYVAVDENGFADEVRDARAWLASHR